MPFPPAFQGSASRRSGLQSDLATFRINAAILPTRLDILLFDPIFFRHRPAILLLPMVLTGSFGPVAARKNGGMLFA